MIATSLLNLNTTKWGENSVWGNEGDSAVRDCFKCMFLGWEGKDLKKPKNKPKSLWVWNEIHGMKKWCSLRRFKMKYQRAAPNYGGVKWLFLRRIYQNGSCHPVMKGGWCDTSGYSENPESPWFGCIQLFHTVFHSDCHFLLIFYTKVVWHFFWGVVTSSTSELEWINTMACNEPLHQSERLGCHCPSPVC